MSVTDKLDAGQGEQPRVKHRLDRWLASGGVALRRQKRRVDGVVGEVGFVEQCEQRGCAAFGDGCVSERGKVGAAGFDEERIRARAHGGVALTEDCETPVLSAEFVR